MVLNFKELDLHKRPVLILRNMDCVPFGVLGKAFNVNGKLRYNETCELAFDVPATDSGEPTPFYDDIKAMNIIDWKGVGQFILKRTEVNTDGVREVKHCTAYSLEFEMSYKQFFAEHGTYNFWNPISPKGTIVGMILEALPYWSIGSIDASLIGKYRTFECSNENVYGFIKNTAQAAYGCVFTFDTYARKINVIDVNSIVPTAEVFLSTRNLIKEITLTENIEEIYTCFDPYGADDLSIRSVNPLGTNKIYNLDYFMTETNVSSEIIEKWGQWKKRFEDYQLPYYNLKVEESIQSARLLTEKAALTDMNGALKKLEGLQSVSVQYLSEHPHDTPQQERPNEINAQIKAQNRLFPLLPIIFGCGLGFFCSISNINAVQRDTLHRWRDENLAGIGQKLAHFTQSGLTLFFQRNRSLSVQIGWSRGRAENIRRRSLGRGMLLRVRGLFFICQFA